MASIARKNLFEDIPRFLVAQAGIMFAVSLVTIQIGILDGFTRSTVRLIEQSKADLWVSHKSMEFLDLSSPLTLDEWMQIRQVSGVERAEPLAIQGTRWRSPSGKINNIRIYSFDPNGQLFANWNLRQGQVDALKQPYTILVDQANQEELGLKKLGDTGEIASLPAKLVGLTQDTQSMASSAFVFTSLETANAYLFSGLTAEVKCTRQASGELRCLNVFEKAPDDETSQETPPAPKPLNLSSPITYVLVKAKVGQDLETLRRSLEAAIPNTRVHTQHEMAQLTRSYWRERTGVGFILGLGAVVGFVVGMVVVSQILYSSVSDNLKEFGTLKAMGASDWVIYRVITEQALWMAILGYAPSILLCSALGVWTMAVKGIMILITPATAAGIFGITLVMCIGSAVFAIQKVTHVDPAIVFKA
jgi:putative ABC transport system permease protein